MKHDGYDETVSNLLRRRRMSDAIVIKTELKTIRWRLPPSFPRGLVVFDPVKEQVKSLFSALISDNGGHCHGLDQVVRLKEFNNSNIFAWKPQYRDFKRCAYSSEGLLYDLRIDRLNPPAFQYPHGKGLVYTVPLSGYIQYFSGRAHHSIRVNKLFVCVKLSYKLCLQSMAMGIVMKNITSVQTMMQLVDYAKHTSTVTRQECSLAQLAQFYLDTRHVSNWRLLVVAGGRAPLPNVTCGIKSQHRYSPPPPNA